MNKLILNSILKRIEKEKTKLLISSLTYYAILAIIPTSVLSITLLNIFNRGSNYYQILFSKLSLNLFSNIIISSITIYMISRIFFLIIREKKTLIKSLFYSILFAIVFVLMFTVFLYTTSIKNVYLNWSLKLTSIFLFSFSTIHFISKSKLKYSVIFSLLFCLISNIFIFIFTTATNFFINYESYYGVLAPIFLLILSLNLFIYMFIIAYISSEEFTNFSNIKIIKG